MHTDARRLKAARALGGFDSQAALAKALTLPRFGERTIREVEIGERPLFEHEAAAVAAACQISPEFFTVDLARIGGPAVPTLTPDVARELLEQLVEVAVQVRQRDAEGQQPGQAGTGRQGGAAGGSGA